VRYVKALCELNCCDSLEALAQVRLHPGWILGLRQDLQQLVVGQEEEAREEETLLFQIGVEALEDELQEFVGLFESVEHFVDLDHGHGMLVQGHCLDYFLPGLVDGGEAAAFLGHLSHDVWRGEDGLQVEPARLHLEPLVEDLLQQDQGLLPLHYLGLEGLDVRRAAHCLRLYYVIVQEHLKIKKENFLG